MYASSCANACDEILAAAHEQHAACLGQVEPLVRVERDRVGSVEPGEQVPGRRRRRRGKAVGAVDVEPDTRSAQTSASAPIGSTAPVSVVPAVATTATGTRPAARSAAIAAATASGHEPPLAVDRQRADVRGADAEQLGRTLDRVVRLLGAVERRLDAPPSP